MAALSPFHTDYLCIYLDLVSMVSLLMIMTASSGIMYIPIKSQQILKFSLLVFSTIVNFVCLFWFFMIILFLTYDMKLPREILNPHIFLDGPQST